MVSEIRIYVEGGGGKDSKDQLRQAFSRFFAAPRLAARERAIHWRVVMCGSRDDAYRAFERAVRNRGSDRSFLLVDADRPVEGTLRQHLSGGETRWSLSFADDEQCHLMVEVMESWFLADPAVLEQVYGRDFSTSQIPKRVNVEEIPKSEVYAVLDRATRKTRKGRYDKAEHGPLILERLDPQRVRDRAPHCERLFKTLEEAIG